MPPPYSKSVFINCAFDDDFRPIFRAVVFTVLDCGYSPRSALEEQDGGDIRISKIQRLIEGSQLGIHDISRVELDTATGLPRFNMPFELGLFLGAKRYGSGRDRDKRCLIMDSDPHRYTIFFTDIRGQDPESHDGEPTRAIAIVRDWLNHGRRRTLRPLPGGQTIARRYRQYLDDLPRLAADVELAPDTLDFRDEAWLMKTWLQQALPDGNA